MYTITAKLVSKSLLKEGESEHGKWVMLTFIVEKQYKKKKRKFAFIAYNNVAKKIISTPKNERITINFYPECREYENKWYTNLRVFEVEKWISKRKMKDSLQVGGESLLEVDYSVKDDRPLFDTIGGGNG